MIYHTNYPLQTVNAFRTEAYARLFCEPTGVEELQKAIRENPHIPKLIVGGGCNLFFTQDFDGLVIRPALKGWHEQESQDEQIITIEVMASENWDEFVNHCVLNGYCGLENLSYIPGTVGAAPVQNIGAYGTEVKDYIQEVVALNLDTGEASSFSNAECQFAYRNSIFKQTKKYVIVSVLFRLSKQFIYQDSYLDLRKELAEIESPSIQQVRDAIIRIRQRKLPDHHELPNCGSFFKNPSLSSQKAEQLRAQYPDIPLFPIDDYQVKTSAAYLIDKAGWKGVRKGLVGTYSRQPLIIVNYGTSKGSDIVAFMKEIQSSVMEQFNIHLEPEVWIY